MAALRPTSGPAGRSEGRGLQQARSLSASHGLHGGVPVQRSDPPQSWWSNGWAPHTGTNPPKDYVALVTKKGIGMSQLPEEWPVPALSRVHWPPSPSSAELHSQRCTRHLLTNTPTEGNSTKKLVSSGRSPLPTALWPHHGEQPAGKASVDMHQPRAAAFIAYSRLHGEAGPWRNGDKGMVIQTMACRHGTATLPTVGTASMPWQRTDGLTKPEEQAWFTSERQFTVDSDGASQGFRRPPGKVPAHISTIRADPQAMNRTSNDTQGPSAFERRTLASSLSKAGGKKTVGRAQTFGGELENTENVLND